MTDKEIIRAEIERRIYRNKRNKVFEDVPEKRHQLIIEGQLLGELKHFINSMQEEPVSEDLEKEIQHYFCKEWDGDPVAAARHFANWQKE